MAGKRQPRTLAEVCVARAGGNFRSIRKGMRVWEFIVQWALLSALEDRAISLVEYREFWGEPVRTAARHLAEFRECFGEGREAYTDPEPFADVLREHFDRDRLERLRGLRRNRKLSVSELEVGDLLGVRLAL